MPIHSTPFGRTVIIGEDVKAFMLTLKQGRGNKAAADSAANGRKLVAEFAARGSVTIKLRMATEPEFPTDPLTPSELAWFEASVAELDRTRFRAGREVVEVEAPPGTPIVFLE